MKKGNVQKFFFPRVPNLDFEKGYFGGDHNALVWSAMDKMGLCLVMYPLEVRKIRATQKL